MDFRQRVRNLFCLFSTSVLLTGCLLGPNFHKADAPPVKSYNETPLPKKTVSTPKTGSAGKSQTFVSNQDIPADWWYLLHSPEINNLVQAGLANSPTLVAAEATLRQSQEVLNAQIGNSLFPAFSAQGSGYRQRFTGNLQNGRVPPSIFNLFNTNVSVSYTLDVFGGARRQIESLRAQVDYSAFQFVAAYLSLTSNIVTTAVTVASLQEQIRVTHELIQAEEDQLTLLKKQFRYGGVAETNVLTQQTLVDQTRATLPVLQKSLSQSLHSLSVLVGAFPDGKLPNIRLSSLTLPKNLPVSLPAKLVRQRPDVRASEASLHAACAQVGVATANLFPQFNITGNYGWISVIASNLFTPMNKSWLIGSQITQPIFQGGALLANRRAAIDAYNAAGAQYQETVLQAFQNVADSLRAIETDAREFRSQREAELAAKRNLNITLQQYKVGGVDYLNVLTAQAQYQQTSLARIQAQAARYTDTAALFQALGGGWWHHEGQEGL